MNNIICIAGPTASGKTALAIELAKELNGEVVSCDSMQVYRRMDIGTAKPTEEEKQGIVHHMLDVAEPWEDFSVSRYCEMASPIVDDIIARGKTAIIAGGTGLYMDSLIKGNSFAPFPATGMREKLEQQADADRKRILRALEVYYETGETITAHNLRTQAIPPKYDPVWFCLDFTDRADLYSRIDLRVSLMLEQGLVAEIQGLLAEGIPAKCTAMQAIGYKEFVDALEGNMSIEEAADQVRQSSRRYAKRQLTWFRRNPNMHWLMRNEDTKTSEILAVTRQILHEIDN